MAHLPAKVRCLTNTGLTIIDVMAVAIDRRVQPLWQRQHPLCMYNGTDDTTRSIQRGFKNEAAFGAAIAGIYKGEATDFAKKKFIDGLSYYNLGDRVSFLQDFYWLSSTPHSLLTSMCLTSNGGSGSKG